MSYQTGRAEKEKLSTHSMSETKAIHNVYHVIENAHILAFSNTAIGKYTEDISLP